jgi:membrane protease YdiL (CAAX protease family)
MMFCLEMNPAIRRYLRRFAVAMSAYIALILIVVLCFRHLHPTGPLAYLLAVLPAVAIIGMIVTAGLYLAEEKDEFQRNLFVQALLWGLGGVLTVTSVWGMLESFTHIQHFEPTWTFTVFCIFVGISTPFLKRRYR